MYVIVSIPVETTHRHGQDFVVVDDKRAMIGLDLSTNISNVNLQQRSTGEVYLEVSASLVIVMLGLILVLFS